jgi:hypothetical protein
MTTEKLYCDENCGRIATVRDDNRWLCSEHARVAHLLDPRFTRKRMLEPSNGGGKNFA